MKFILTSALFALSMNAGAQSLVWQKTSNNGAQVLTVINNTLFAAGGNGIHSTPDKGANWTHLTAAYPTSYFHSITTDGTNLYAGGEHSNPLVLKSSDFGNSWVNVTPPTLTAQPRSILVLGDTIFLGVRGSQSVYISLINGLSASTWTAFGSGLGNRAVMSLAVSCNSLLAATESNGIWRTSLTANAWQSSSAGMGGSGNYYPTVSLAAKDSLVFASLHASKPNLFRSVNCGQTWTNISTSPTFDSGTAYHVYLRDGILYVGFELGTGPAISYNLGANWTTEGAGMTSTIDKNVSAFAKIGQTLFAGAMSGVWKTEITLSADEGSILTRPGFTHTLNPGQSELRLVSGDPAQGNQVQFYDLTGRLLFKSAISHGENSYSVAHYRAGLYVLHITDQEGNPLFISRVVIAE